MSGQTTAVGVADPRCPGLAASRVRFGAHAGHRRVELLECERQLIGIKLLGPCDEPVALERGGNRGQPLDLRLGVGTRVLQIRDKRLLLGDLAAGRDQHRPEQRGVVGRSASTSIPGVNQRAHTPSTGELRGDRATAATPPPSIQSLHQRPPNCAAVSA